MPPDNYNHYSSFQTVKPKTKETKETIITLPFPFNGKLVITSMKQKNEAQAKVELQDLSGNVIRTLTSASATSN